MEEILTKIRQNLIEDPLTLAFRGLDNFSNKVLYAKIDGKESLDRLKWIADIVKESFAVVEGVTVKDEQLSAHLTIMKMSKMPFKKKRVVKKIDPASYNEAIELEFGEEPVTGLQLLSMSGSSAEEEEDDDQRGYYKCLKEIFI